MKRLLLFAIALCVAPLAAQQPAFKSGVELVTVPISVTNAARSQLIVSGLSAADFHIFEDDQPQKVEHLRQDGLPVSLCVVVDASGSMATARRHD